MAAKLSNPLWMVPVLLLSLFLVAGCAADPTAEALDATQAGMSAASEPAPRTTVIPNRMYMQVTAYEPVGEGIVRVEGILVNNDSVDVFRATPDFRLSYAYANGDGVQETRWTDAEATSYELLPEEEEARAALSSDTGQPGLYNIKAGEARPFRAYCEFSVDEAVERVASVYANGGDFVSFEDAS